MPQVAIQLTDLDMLYIYTDINCTKMFELCLKCITMYNELHYENFLKGGGEHWPPGLHPKSAPAFGIHLRDAKVHGELSKHYWWPTIFPNSVRAA